MIEKKKLNDSWKVTWTDGVHGLRIKEDFYQYPPENDPGRYLDIDLPVDMNTYFMDKGIIDNLYTENHHLKARWISEQFYQFTKSFTWENVVNGEKIYLVFKKLDYKAHIYFNNQLIAIHENVHVPCRTEISDYLVEGENKIVVGLESGIYDTAEKEGQRYQNMIAGSLTKSQWMRKPLYQFGWDWNPILINVGIKGDVELEIVKENKIDQVSVFHKLNDDLSKARFFVKLVMVNETIPKDGTITVNIDNKTFDFPVDALDRNNCFELEFTLDNPQLWWPVNVGEQHLYTLEVLLQTPSEILDRRKMKTGVRKIEIDRTPHPAEGEYFIIKINNERIFCKGANWVPPDLIYGENHSNTIEKLISHALEANFNILRVWGGGEYAPDKLMELCDEKGILLWHDFLFACFKFPGDHPGYVDNLKKDTTWAIREFSTHPSLIVWCGNNEVQWIFEQAEEKSFDHATDYNIYHEIIPEILNHENCTIPYWPGSPYSPGEIDNNASYIGDQHPWQFPLLDNRLDMWLYREREDRFPNEGGVLGISTLHTLKKFIPDNQRFIRSFVWETHDNTCNYWDNELGFCYQMIQEWFGMDYKALSLEEYVFAGSLIQSEGLMEYIMNYRCRKFDTSSAIFWMFNDSWPATHSWSIVDYYLRKKPAFYSVKRANASLYTGLRKTADGITVFAVNDCLQHANVSVKIGIIDTMNKTNQILVEDTIELAGNISEELFTITSDVLPMEQHDSLIPYSILLNESGQVISQNRMFLKKHKNMHFNPPKVNIIKNEGEIRLTSDTFVWGVCLDLQGEEVPDNFFDLIPGQVYIFPQKNNQNLEIKYFGNQLLT